MFHLPEDFLHFMREVYGTEAANAWFQRLPYFLEEYAERWQLTLLPPFENLSFHYVAGGRHQSSNNLTRNLEQLVRIQ